MRIAISSLARMRQRQPYPLTEPQRGFDLRCHLPAAAVVIWLAVVAWAVWQHVEASGQPLIYDAITYWLKAKNFWTSVAHEQWVNPLNIEPTTRPPGTILMSYPFGFDESPKGFLFRSVFFGIALTAWAVFLVARALPRITTRGWDVACVALFLSALPLHFHFELSSAANSPGYWGLTDSFLAGLAALTSASAILGATRGAWGWTTVAAILAGLCFLIKPAGALIMATVTCAWFVIIVVRGWAARSVLGPQIFDWRTLRIGVFVFGGVCGAVLLAAFRSRYFSAENVAFGNRVLKVMADDWLSVSLPQLHIMIRNSFGYAFVIASATAVAAGIACLRSGTAAPASDERALALGGLLGAIGSLVVGSWFWLVKSGGSQVRYFYPFALVAAASILPLAFLAFHGAGRQTRIMVRTLLLLPPLGIVFLLLQPDPPPAWQRLFGVNLAARAAGPDVALGRRVLETVRRQGRGVTLYAASSGETAAIESLWALEELAHPGLANIHVKRPFDWERPSAFRLAEMGNAEWILFRPFGDLADRERLLSAPSLNSYAAEQQFFAAWFSTLGTQAGVEIFGEASNLRLLRVVDQGRFQRALADLRLSRRWRPEFIAANPQTWWSEGDISRRLAGQDTAATAVGFGGLFRVEAVVLRREGDSAHVDFWWRPDAEPPPSEWFFFVHLVDAVGTILANTGVRLADHQRRLAEQPFRLQSLSVPLVATGATAIAFGIYRVEAGQAVTLAADRGDRDWDNRRVLVPLP
jgi:hypothetical protein